MKTLDFDAGSRATHAAAPTCPARRSWLRGAAGTAAFATRLPLVALASLVAFFPRAIGATRAVDDLPITLTLPDDWIPIPRAEIVEATERARTAGGVSDWTLRAAWQRVPHLRWFTLPHLLLETRAATGSGAPAAAVVEHTVGRAGPREVHTHRVRWSRDGTALQLTLLSWADERAAFETWVADLRDVGQPLRR